MEKIFRVSGFPLVPQLLTLAAFAALAAIGFSVDTADAAFAKILRNTNLANLAVWSLWWPLVILSAIFFGRVWCMVCPMELVTSLCARIGLKRRPPAFLQSGWAITLFFVAIVFVGLQVLSIHRIPFRMAGYLLLLFVMAMASGLLFERNIFCRHLCPVGHLLGLYARFAPFGWGVKDKAVCAGCKDKSCIANRNAYAFQGHSCGVGLHPATLEDNTDCLLCGQCLKACDRNKPEAASPRPNPGWFRRSGLRGLATPKPLSPAQIAFCLIVSGFVIYEILSEWNTTKEMLLWLPDKLIRASGSHSAWIKGLVTATLIFAFLPALFWLVPFAAARLCGIRLTLRDYAGVFGLAFIPVMAAAHATKALIKLLSRIPYWPYAVSDPFGEATARGILSQAIRIPELPAWYDPAITILSLALMGTGIALSLAMVRKLVAKHAPDSGWRSLPLYLIPGAYGGIFIATLVAWRLF